HGALKLVQCTVEGNQGGSGGLGGLSGGGYMQYIEGGSGGAGGPGGICCVGNTSLELIACTVAGNSGTGGGNGGSGVPDYSHLTGQGGGGPGGAGGLCRTNPAAPATLINTIVAGNLGGPASVGGPYVDSHGAPGAADLQGSFTSLGHNLIGQADRSSGFTNGINGDLAGSTNAPLDPVLGPLADNGGPTSTMALLHGSPALDAGEDALLQPPYHLRQDQRGFPRKSGAHVDIGAFEFQSLGHDVHAPLAGPALFGGGFVNASNATAAGFRFSFTDAAAGATFTVLASTNLSLPIENWSILGQPLQVSPGLFQFTDPDAENSARRFYRISSP
ncbi:MAG: choice-of-anchor Q domain-containing protein, partial [Limisphaerales bacterium]